MGVTGNDDLVRRLIYGALDHLAPGQDSERRVLRRARAELHSSTSARIHAPIRTLFGALVAASVVALLGAAIAAGLGLRGHGQQGGSTSSSSQLGGSHGGAAAATCLLPLDREGAGILVAVPPNVVASSHEVTPELAVVPDQSRHLQLPDGEAPFGQTYDWNYRSWLPVPPEWMSSDGNQYAFADRDGHVWLIDVPDDVGKPATRDGGWTVVGFQAGGVYLATAGDATHPSHGLWLLRTATHALTQLRRDGPWVSVANGAAWAVMSNEPASSGDHLVRLDLTSGRTSTWFSSDGSDSGFAPGTMNGDFRLVGVDAQGDAFLSEYENGNPETFGVFWMVSGLSRRARVSGGIFSNAVADGERTWFAENYGPAIWVKDGNGIRAVGGPGGDPVSIAGPCRPATWSSESAAPKIPPTSFPPCSPSVTATPGIHNGGVQVGPGSYDTFQTANQWLGPAMGSSIRWYHVYAGKTGTAARQPLVPAVWVNETTLSADGCSTPVATVGVFLNRAVDGELRITSVSGSTVHLETSSGQRLVFDLVSRRFVD